MRKPPVENKFLLMPVPDYCLESRDPMLFRGTVPGSNIDIEEHTHTEEEEKTEKEKLIICRTCKNIITSPDESISIDGSHTHTFMNPAGILYHIGCFAHARGCALYGPSSSEYSWFTGYIWTVAICSVCSTHMGWKFTSGGSVFFGLIMDNIADN